jgi:hypothetical protein
MQVKGVSMPPVARRVSGMYICSRAGGGFSRFRESGVLLVASVRFLGSPFPPAHCGHPILPLLVSFTSLRRSSLRVVAIMTAADGRDGPGEDSVPRAIGRNHRNWS